MDEHWLSVEEYEARGAARRAARDQGPAWWWAAAGALMFGVLVVWIVWGVM